MMMTTYLGKLEPIAHVVLGEDDRLRTSPSRGNSLLAQTTNPQHLAGQCDLASHGNALFDLRVERQTQ
jgi:hypothetical protein